MPKKTKTEIKTAIKNVLNKVTIGSEGGSINGSIVITGENNFVKAPAFKIGDTDLSTFIEEAGKVKTVNNQQPDSTGNIDIPISVNNIQRDDTGNITLTPSDVGASASDHTHAYLPLAGGTMTGSTVYFYNRSGVSTYDNEPASCHWAIDEISSSATNNPNGVWNIVLTFHSSDPKNGFQLAMPINNKHMAFRVRDYVENTQWLGWRTLIDSSGGQTINGALTCTGWMYAAGHKATSDSRLKEEKKKVSYDISSVSPYRYRLKTDNEYHVGLLAQEVEKIIPEAVSENKDGYKSLDYNAVVAVLVGQVNALTKRIEELEKR